MKSYDIKPVPKPRMTQRDKWLNPRRPAVQKYYDFKMQCLLEKVFLPEDDAHVIFVLPMPKSWRKKKKADLEGKRHKQRPDLSNLLKALEDALYLDDSKISDIRATKVWGYMGKIEIH
jgi:Holliday junction resolvase RusA-like endonuclease